MNQKDNGRDLQETKDMAANNEVMEEIPSNSTFKKGSSLKRRPSQLDPEFVLKCPAGHGTKLAPLDEDLECDLCEGEFKEGYYMYSCRACEFDICPACQTELQGQDLDQVEAQVFSVPPLPNFDLIKIENKAGGSLGEFEPLFQQAVAEWKSQGKDVKEAFKLQGKDRAQLTLEEFEAACKDLGNPVSQNSYDKVGALALFGIEGTRNILWKRLEKFIDDVPDEAIGKAEPTKEEGREKSRSLSLNRLPSFETFQEQLAEKSLFIFKKDFILRKWCIKLTINPWFDNFITFVILINSVIIALVDYSNLDDEGELTAAGSARNTLVEESEIYFTVIFIAECVVKVIGLGFVLHKNTYLRDGWNVLDFIVVLASLLVYANGLPNVSAFRTFRVLRPLKSLSKFPGLRSIISSLINSLKSLGQIAFFLFFVISIYGVLGVTFFAGALHARCRRTPYPTKLDPDCQYITMDCWADYVTNVTTYPERYRCLDEENDNESWGLDDSPWHTPQDCVWLVDDDHDRSRVCSLSGSGGETGCRTACGSNYDLAGNPRFINSHAPFDFPRMMSGTFQSDLAYGFINFDNFGISFLSVFQVITLEGWTDIMYMCMDAVHVEGSALVFVSLVFLGSFVILNMMLGVITKTINDDKHEAEEEEEEEKSLFKSSSFYQLQNPPDLSADDAIPPALSSAVKLKLAQDGGHFVEGERVFYNDEQQGRMKATILKAHYDKGTADQYYTIQFSNWNCWRAKCVKVQTSGSTLLRFPLWRLKLEACREELDTFVDGNLFQFLMLLCIILNTIILALDKYPEDANTDYILNVINLTLTGVFAVEMVLMLIAKGFHEYCRYNFNLFDGFIVITSLIEVAVIYGTNSSGGGISALRTFRLFRIFKLAKQWKELQVLLHTIVKTMMEIGNFAVLLFLFIYIYALIGMQFFATKLHFEEATGAALSFGDDGYHKAEIPRMNFDTLLWSLVTVFACLTMENWNSVMYACWMAAGDGAVVYFVTLIVFGSFIIMNLFLAILLSNFEGNEDLLNAPTSNPMAISALVSPLALTRQSSKPLLKQGGKTNVFSEDKLKIAATKLQEEEEEAKEKEKLSTAIVISKVVDKCSNIYTTIETNTQGCRDRFSEFQKPLRKVVEHPRFDQFICLAIIISSLLLAIDHPLLNPNSQKAKNLKICNYFFVALFLAEACLKILAMGLFFGKRTYLRDGWNVVDFLIVICSVISLVEVGNDAVMTLRVIRVIRPLRMVQRFPGLKKVVNVMVRSVPTMLKTLCICALFFLIFAIIGVNYLKGALSSCQGDAFDALSEEQVELLTYPEEWSSLTEEQQSWFNGTSCFGEDAFSDEPTSLFMCECWGGSWDPVIDQSFNNVLEGMFTLFEISTTEGWVDVMLAAVDQQGIEMQPIKNSSLQWVFFFLLFMIFGSFFIMNLFVGVVIDFFNRERHHQNVQKQKEGGDGHERIFMTEAQHKWAETRRFIQRLRSNRKPPIPHSRIRKRVYRLTASNPFEFCILFCIVINGIVMAMQYFGQSDLYGEVLDNINISFALIFTLEAILKLIALGHHYFKDNWNRFDITIVIATDVGLLIEFVSGSEMGSVASVVRMCRIARVFRIANQLEGLNRMFMALVSSIPSFGNVAAVLLLMFFIYALVGVQLFCRVAYQEEIYPDAHFGTLDMALLTLVRFATGENWNGFMYSLMNDIDGCTLSSEPYNEDWCLPWENKRPPECQPIDGCGVDAAQPYLYSFILIVMFTMMNLFIGIILESIEEGEESDFDTLIDKKVLEDYEITWQKADKYYSSRIPRFLVGEFLKSLGSTLPDQVSPLGFNKKEQGMNKVAMESIIDSYRIPTIMKGGTEYVTYEGLATALARNYIMKYHAKSEFRDNMKQIFNDEDEKERRRSTKSGRSSVFYSLSPRRSRSTTDESVPGVLTFQGDTGSRTASSSGSSQMEQNTVPTKSPNKQEAYSIIGGIEDQKTKQRAALEYFLDKKTTRKNGGKFFNPEKYSAPSSAKRSPEQGVFKID